MEQRVSSAYSGLINQFTSNVEHFIVTDDRSASHRYFQFLHELPAIRVRIVTLDRVQTELTFPTTDCVNEAIQRRQSYIKEKWKASKTWIHRAIQLLVNENT